MEMQLFHPMKAISNIISLFGLIQHILITVGILSIVRKKYYLLLLKIIDTPKMMSLAVTEPLIYDNNCSCALNAKCTTQANFLDIKSSNIIPVKGLKMGCTPSESFLASTLECFYDQACINLIEGKYNYTFSINTTNSTRFLPNTTVIDLINELFVDTWLTTLNYSAYYEYCSPIFCSYTYIQQLNSLYTATLVLGFYGGLSIVLKWICPKIIYFLFILYQYRKKRSHRIVAIQNSHRVTATIDIEPIHSPDTTALVTE